MSLRRSVSDCGNLFPLLTEEWRGHAKTTSAAISSLTEIATACSADLAMTFMFCKMTVAEFVRGAQGDRMTMVMCLRPFAN